MEHGWVMTTWRTVHCDLCRRERRHFSNTHGEVCSWCGNLREEVREPEDDTSVRHPLGPRRS